MNKDLEKAMKSGNQIDLSNQVERFKKMHMEDNPVLTKAITQSEVVSLCGALKDAVLSNRVDRLEKAIYKTENSTHSQRSKVKKALGKAKAKLSDLLTDRPLSGMTTRTATGLKTLIRLSPVAHTVLRAVFLLLGEHDSYVEDPKNVAGLLKQSGNSLCSRLERCDLRTVRPDVSEQASRLISMYTTEDITRANRDVAKVYNLMTKKLASLSANEHTPSIGRDGTSSPMFGTNNPA
ncbi:uncharacterized protein LOC121373918 [Gigantopelta aegis]|uniref:uncharacterized protein LOC121373918 n=1 Tax=Gigantopelta aegis TaxID=1735272 RepID=UPI001B88D405|nr:uncharacterized protein LOC121373918 [Gigantopelta aegis]